MANLGQSTCGRFHSALPLIRKPIVYSSVNPHVSSVNPHVSSVNPHESSLILNVSSVNSIIEACLRKESVICLYWTGNKSRLMLQTARQKPSSFGDASLDVKAPLWSGTNKNRDVSTGPLASPFACSLTSLTPSLVGK